MFHLECIEERSRYETIKCVGGIASRGEEKRAKARVAALVHLCNHDRDEFVTSVERSKRRSKRRSSEMLDKLMEGAAANKRVLAFKQSDGSVFSNEEAVRQAAHGMKEKAEWFEQLLEKMDSIQWWRVKLP